MQSSWAQSKPPHCFFPSLLNKLPCFALEHWVSSQGHLRMHDYHSWRRCLWNPMGRDQIYCKGQVPTTKHMPILTVHKETSLCRVSKGQFSTSNMFYPENLGLGVPSLDQGCIEPENDGTEIPQGRSEDCSGLLLFPFSPLLHQPRAMIKSTRRHQMQIWSQQNQDSLWCLVCGLV